MKTHRRTTRGIRLQRY